jgi:hypothetical protein
MSAHDDNPTALEEVPLPEDAMPVHENSGSLESPRSEEGASDLVYNPVPSPKRVAITIQYRVRGRGRLLAYPLAEEDGE